ncbi:MAG: putative hydrolase of the superfamily [Actinomycetota bacterium]|jgi:putative hydrolase of the HAD superfamily
MTTVDAITFDHWNTLVYEEEGANLSHRRIDAWVARLHEEGHAIEPELLRGTFATTWEAFTVDWHAGVQRSGADAARHALSILDLPITDELHGELVDHFVDAGRSVDFPLTAGIEDCLRALKDAGLKIGIVCDVGFTPSAHLRDHLDRRGLLKHFDGWSFSDEVGAYKPDKIIFDHALGTLGNPPAERVAHVGDLRRTDIAGALGMGMTAIRYAGVFDDPAENGPEATFTITNYADLPELLGV